MLMVITEDRMGNILARPLARQARFIIRSHLKDMGQTVTATAFMQEGMGAEQFTEKLTARQRADLRRNGSVTIHMPNEEVCCLFGIEITAL